MRSAVAAVCLSMAAGVSAHSLSPTRVEAPSGAGMIAYRFTAINDGPHSEVFAIECYKGGFATPFPCNYVPTVLMMKPKSMRTFKVQMLTQGDGLYLVCTRQEPRNESQTVLTRVCARFGVGVSASTQPDDYREYSTTKRSNLPAGAGQSTSR